MHLVVDLQGAQAPGRYPDVRRATLSLASALMRNASTHRVTFVLNGLFPETIEPLTEALSVTAPGHHIRIWQAMGPTAEANLENQWRREVSERLREAFIATLRPDVVLMTGCFDGYRDDGVWSIDLLASRIPAAAVLFTPMSLSDPTAQRQRDFSEQAWYQRRLDTLARCRKIFAVTEQARRELAEALNIDADRIAALGVAQEASYSWDDSARLIWQQLSALRGAIHEAASPLLNVDRTGIFHKRSLKILVTKLDHLGDFLLSVPALAKLRARYPDAAIDIVVGSWNVGAARALNLFRNVHAFDYFKRKSSEKASLNDAELSALLRALDVYDMAIDLRRQPDSRFLLVQTNAQLKIGYQTLDPAIDQGLDIMLRVYKEGAHIRTPMNSIPIGKQILRLVDALPADVNDFVSLPDIAVGVARQRGRVAIFPKAGTDAREWDPQNVRQLVGAFLASVAVTDVQIFFVNKAEAAQYGFESGTRLTVHVGLDFSSLTKLLASSNLCIANNSGGIHLASYLGVPTIGIYSGHELSAEWGPQFHDSIVIHRGATCAPCHLGTKADCPYDNFCLGDISADDVYRKSLEVLAGTADGAALQCSDDDIVRGLIADLGGRLPAGDRQSWLAVSRVIALNHPAYSALTDADAACDRMVNTAINHHSRAIEWVGFSAAERDFRWTDGNAATMQFYVEGEDDVPATARLLLFFDTYKRQRIGVSFNGLHARDVVRSGRRILLAVPVSNLRNGLNRLELQLPDARSPGHGDPRLLGLAVRKLKIAVDAADGAVILGPGARWRDSLIRWR